MTKAIAKKALEALKAEKATVLYRIAMCQNVSMVFGQCAMIRVALWNLTFAAKCVVQKDCGALYCNNIQNLFRFGTVPCQRHVHGQSLLAVAIFNLLTEKSRGLAKLKLQPDYVQAVQA